MLLAENLQKSKSERSKEFFGNRMLFELVPGGFSYIGNKFEQLKL